MKIKSVAAVGSLGVGLGFASFLGAGTASAEQCGEAPIGITPTNIICNVEAQATTFAQSISPARNIGILINGENVADEGAPQPSGLGLRDQLGTFTSSLADFATGPQSPDAPSQPVP